MEKRNLGKKTITNKDVTDFYDLEKKESRMFELPFFCFVFIKFLFDTKDLFIQFTR